MARVIQRHIFDVIIIHRLVSESCIRIWIIIASKCYWLIIYQIYDMLFEDRVMMYFLSGLFRLIVFPSIYTPGSEWNNSSHDAYQTNLWYRCVFSKGVEKGNGAGIMMFPLRRCQGSFLSIADLLQFSFSVRRGLMGMPFKHIFIASPVHVWASMLGGPLSWWWPGPESRNIESLFDH
jgi:hypothetical protein